MNSICGNTIRTPKLAAIWMAFWATGQVSAQPSVESIAAKLRDLHVVSEARFAGGAKCDGRSDDSAAIQAAHDSLPPAGGTLQFPAGTCYVPRSIKSTKPNVVWKGAGVGAFDGGGITPSSTELVTDQSDVILEIGDEAAANHGGHVIEGLGFRDLGGKSAGAIRIARMNHVRIRDVGISDFVSGFGVKFQGVRSSILPMIVGLKARETRFPIQTVSPVIGMQVIGGFLALSHPQSGSIGIDWNSPGSNSLRVDGTAIDNFETGVRIQGDQAHIAARFEASTAYTSAGHRAHVHIVRGSGNVVAGSDFVRGAMGIKVDTRGMVIIGPNTYTVPPTAFIDLGLADNYFINEPYANPPMIKLSRADSEVHENPTEIIVRNSSNAANRRAQLSAEVTAIRGALRSSRDSRGLGQVDIGSLSNDPVQFVQNDTVVGRITNDHKWEIGKNGAGISRHLSATAILDFGVTAPGSSEDVRVSVPGAVLGDSVAIGIPNTAVVAAASGYFAWVSAADVVTVRFWNASGANLDPESGVFRVDVWRH